MPGLDLIADTMDGVTIAGTDPGAAAIRTALGALLRGWETTGAAGRIDTNEADVRALTAAKKAYRDSRTASTPTDQNNKLAALATAVAALDTDDIAAAAYGTVAIQAALVTLLNGWETSADAGRLDTAEAAEQALTEARRLYRLQVAAGIDDIPAGP